MSKQSDYTDHQFNLFPFAPPKTKKEKFSAERMKEAAEEWKKGKSADPKVIARGLDDLQWA